MENIKDSKVSIRLSHFPPQKIPEITVTIKQISGLNLKYISPRKTSTVRHYHSFYLLLLPLQLLPQNIISKPTTAMVAATVAAAGGVSLGLTQLHSHKSKLPVITSPFLGKKLTLNSNRIPVSDPKKFRVSAVAGGSGELIDAVRELFLGVGVGLPCTVMECGDIIYRSTLPKPNGLTLTAPGAVLALSALSYLWATPGVAPGFFDMFVLAFVERLFRPTFRKVCKF